MKKIVLSSIFALLLLCGGAYTAHAATVTCYTTCSPSFSSYIGTVVLDLQCNASSPVSYTGSLTVNGVRLSYVKNCNRPPIGNHETASCTASGVALRGWAFDPDSSGASISMHFYEGGSYLGACSANQSRADVNTVYGITGNHGFNCTLPAMLAGNHSITAYAIDTAGGTNPVISNSPRTVTCPAPVAVPLPSCSITFSPSNLATNVAGNVTMSVLNDATNSATCSCTGLDAGPVTLGPTTYPQGPFASAGTKNCTCTVTNSAGVSSTCSDSLTVTAPVVYTCSGSPVTHANYHPGDTTGLGGPTGATYSLNNTLPKCQYRCDPSYVWNTGTSSCDPTCTSSIPADGTQCAGDSTGIPGLSIPWLPVTGCTLARKCEYTLPSLSVFLPDSGPIQVGTETRLTAYPNGGLAPRGPYTWEGDPFSTPKVTTVPYVDVTFLKIGSFDIKVTVKDSLNQTASDLGTVTVEDLRDPQ